MCMRKYAAMALAAAMALTALSGCGGGKGKTQNPDAKAPEAKTEYVTETPKAESPKDGGVIKIGLGANPSTLDPVKYTGIYESQVIRQVGDTLVVYDNDFKEFKPSLAESWEVAPDGKSYTFKIKKGIKFQKGKYQDGREMTVEDVKFSLERSAFHSALNRLTGVKSVDIVDDSTVKINLEESNSAFMAMVTDQGNIIYPKEEVEGWGDEFGQHLIGTGPFMIDNFIAGQEIQLKRNDNYWGEKPHLDGVTFKVIADQNMMTNALLSGDIDIATDIKGQSREVIKKAQGKATLLSTPGLSTTYLDMNCMTGPTTDPKVRRAIYMATDVKAIVEGVNQWGGAQPAKLPIPPTSWAYSKEQENLAPAYDPEGAKKLLAETKYKDGFEIELYCADRRVPYATIFQDQMKKNLNITVKIVTQEWGTYSSTVASGKAPMNIGGWSWYPDPFFYLNNEFYSKSIGTLGNGRGYKNPEVDKLLLEAQMNTKQEERAKIYQKALEIIMKDCSRIELEVSDTAFAVNDKVRDFHINAFGTIQMVVPGFCNVSLN